MVTVIHGDDSKSSRDFLNKLEISFSRFDAIDGNFDELKQLLDGNSLFDISPNVLIENLFSRKAKNVYQTIDFINKTSAAVYIYEAKEVSKNLKLFPKAKSEFFTFPKSLFAFLDSIYPKNIRSLSLFEQALETSELEILVFLIIKQLRMMLALNLNAQIDEVGRLQDWQRSKLLKQASYFGIEKIKKAYREIFEIDKAAKSGGLTLPFKETIDIWLLNL